LKTFLPFPTGYRDALHEKSCRLEVDIKTARNRRGAGFCDFFVSFCTTLKPKLCFIARFRAIISKAMGLIGGAPGHMEDSSAIAL
jgi:hypothetical protein